SGGIEERAMTASSRALAQRRRLRMEVEDRSVGAQAHPVRRANHDTAAGGENNAGGQDEILEGRLLAITKRGFAFDFEYGWNRHAEPRFELGIGIDEHEAQTTCEHLPKRRFACAR